MKHLIRLAAATGLLSAAPAFAADPPSAATSPAAAPSAMGAVKSPGGRNITAFDRKGQSGVGGYFDIEFNQPLDGSPSTFDNHHLILQTSAYLHENLFFNSEVEYEHGGLINDEINDGELKIEQAWADYRVSDALGLRAGVLLVPFGIVNVLHDSDFRETTTRPLMAQNVVPTTWMEPGIGLHGMVYPTEELQLSYEAYVTNGLTDHISTDSGLHEARPSLSKDNNGNKALSARLGLSPWLGLDVGLNGYYGAYDVTGTQHVRMFGLDTAYTAGPFDLVGEIATVGTDGGTFMEGTTPEAISTGMLGYYLEGRYHFFPGFLEPTFLGKGGGFNTATFTLVGRVGQADTDTTATGASDKTEAVIGLNYRPIQTFVTKLEYQRVTDPTRSSDAIWSSIAVGF